MVCQRCVEVNGISEVRDLTPKGNMYAICFTVVCLVPVKIMVGQRHGKGKTEDLRERWQVRGKVFQL